MKPVVKWTGSKRRLSEQIIDYFPSRIKTYKEPFLGGAHIFGEVLKSERVKADKYKGSDLSEPLIFLWRMVKNNPLKLYEKYKEHWFKFQDNVDYYYEVRSKFNEEKNPCDFLFLTRTCYNGLIRFNSSGEFNTSVHIDRQGINPTDLYDIILNWHYLFKNRNVQFSVLNYEEVEVSKNDFLYLDPPYFDTDSIYFSGLNHSDFFEWLKNVSCNYALSFDGKVEDSKQDVFIDKDLYDDHFLLDSSKSSFRKLKKENKRVFESLYLMYQTKKPEKLKNKFFGSHDR